MSKMKNVFKVGLGLIFCTSTLAHAERLGVTTVHTEKSYQTTILTREHLERNFPLFDLNSPNPQWWFSADYLLWWTKSMPSAPLVITGSPPFTTGPMISGAHVPTSPGFIGLSTISVMPSPPLSIDNATEVLAGNKFKIPRHSGERFEIGRWMSPNFGIAVDYFHLDDRTKTVNQDSNDHAVLGMPYFNAANGMPTSYTISQPENSTLSRTFINTTPGVFVHLYDTTTTDMYSGSVSTRASSKMDGGELNGIWKFPVHSNWHPQFLAGFRYIELNESLDIASNVAHTHTNTIQYEPALGLPTGDIPVVDNFTSWQARDDSFVAKNKFYGFQVGTRNEVTWGPWSLIGNAQFGVGTMDQMVRINGLTRTSVTSTTTPTESIFLSGIPLDVATGAPNVTTASSGVSEGGLYAQPTNIGDHGHNTIAGVFQGELKGRYYFTPNANISLGYTFLYLSSVARAGDQIDRNIAPSLLAIPPSTSGASQPAFRMNTSEFWAQGINLGFDVRF